MTAYGIFWCFSRLLLILHISSGPEEIILSYQWLPRSMQLTTNCTECYKKKINCGS